MAFLIGSWTPDCAVELGSLFGEALQLAAFAPEGHDHTGLLGRMYAYALC